MKKLFTMLLVVITFTCLATLPRANAQATTSKTKTTATPKGPKTTTVVGMVSADGRSFVKDKDKTTWEVGNPEALQGDAGQHVRINGQVDAAKGVVTVQSATVEPAKAAKTTKSKTSTKKST